MATRELVSVQPQGRGYRVEYSIDGKPRAVIREKGRLNVFNFVRVVGRPGLEQLLRRKRPALEALAEDDAERVILEAEVEELEWLLAQIPAAEEVGDA